MNEKEAEVVSLKKGIASEVGNDSLIAENSDPARSGGGRC